MEDACDTTLLLFTKLGSSHLPALSKFFAATSIFFDLLFGLCKMPLPPNFTNEQGKIYFDLEKDDIFYDIDEYQADFNSLSDNESVEPNPDESREKWCVRNSHRISRRYARSGQ